MKRKRKRNPGDEERPFGKNWHKRHKSRKRKTGHRGKSSYTREWDRRNKYRGESMRCSVEGCTNFIRRYEGSIPFCRDHILLLPYAAEVSGEIDKLREQEAAAALAEKLAQASLPEKILILIKAAPNETVQVEDLVAMLGLARKRRPEVMRAVVELANQNLLFLFEKRIKGLLPTLATTRPPRRRKQ